MYRAEAEFRRRFLLLKGIAGLDIARVKRIREAVFYSGRVERTEELKPSFESRVYQRLNRMPGIIEQSSKVEFLA